jgi:hypothetical protein
VQGNSFSEAAAEEAIYLWVRRQDAVAGQFSKERLHGPVSLIERQASSINKVSLMYQTA